MPETNRIPTRSEVPESDRWNLSRLYPDEASWETGLKRARGYGARDRRSQGKPRVLARGLRRRPRLLSRLRPPRREALVLREPPGERGRGRRRLEGPLRPLHVRFHEGPGGMGLVRARDPGPPRRPSSTPAVADPRFAEYAVFLRKLLRYKPHILAEGEERLLALQAESSGSRPGRILGPHQRRPGLRDDRHAARDRGPSRSRATRPSCAAPTRAAQAGLRAILRGLRRAQEHLGRPLLGLGEAGQVPRPRAALSHGAGGRPLPRRRERERLRQPRRDGVGEPAPPPRVLRAAQAGPRLDELRHYDVYVPLAPEAKARHSYAEAVGARLRSPELPSGTSTSRPCAPGSRAAGSTATRTRASTRAPSPRAPTRAIPTYSSTTRRRSSTMSSPSPTRAGTRCTPTTRPRPTPSSPTATLSSRPRSRAPSTSSSCSAISTTGGDDGERASLASAKLDDIVGTLFRQTMFAEFERRSHEMVEADEPLTVDALRAEYRKLLEKYFGPSIKPRGGERPRVPAHPPLLQRFLRLQVRDGHLREHSPLRAGARRGKARARGLLRLPALGRLPLPDRVPQSGGRRHVERPSRCAPPAGASSIGRRAQAPAQAMKLGVIIAVEAEAAAILATRASTGSRSGSGRVLVAGLPDPARALRRGQGLRVLVLRPPHWRRPCCELLLSLGTSGGLAPRSGLPRPREGVRGARHARGRPRHRAGRDALRGMEGPVISSLSPGEKPGPRALSASGLEAPWARVRLGRPLYRRRRRGGRALDGGRAPRSATWRARRSPSSAPIRVEELDFFALRSVSDNADHRMPSFPGKRRSSSPPGTSTRTSSSSRSCSIRRNRSRVPRLTAWGERYYFSHMLDIKFKRRLSRSCSPARPVRAFRP
jgi:oligoendopeptidase F